MLSSRDYQDVLQMRRDFAKVYSEWKQLISDYYSRKFNPQPRRPQGPGGGQWTSDGGSAALSSKPSNVIAVAGQSAAFC